MKPVIALGFALLVAGCASGPYYTGYGGSGDAEPYAYGPYYSYYDYPVYYGYPAVIGGSLFYYDRDEGHRDGRRWRDGNWRDGDRGWRGRDNDRGRDQRSTPPVRERLDTPRRESGNEGGM
jgi:hypothetical protein